MATSQHDRQAPYPDAEWRMRVDLAACYRLADLCGFSDIVWGHITARVPGTDHFLINRFGLRFDEVKASNLVKLDLDGNVIDPGIDSDGEAVNHTGFIIHSAVHAARPDIHCVMHSHPDGGLAVSVLADGLLPMIQDAMPLYGRTSCLDYTGLAMDEDEGARVAASLGANKAMIMRNHGLLTCGETVGEAFMHMYYLERACQVQMRVLSSGQAFDMPSAEICDQAANQYEHFPYGKYEWPALLRLADKKSPGFRE